jgi:hypothetical protein
MNAWVGSNEIKTVDTLSLVSLPYNPDTTTSQRALEIIAATIHRLLPMLKRKGKSHEGLKYNNYGETSGSRDKIANKNALIESYSYRHTPLSDPHPHSHSHQESCSLIDQDNINTNTDTDTDTDTDDIITTSTTSSSCSSNNNNKKEAKSTLFCRQGISPHTLQSKEVRNCASALMSALSSIQVAQVKLSINYII